MAQARSMIKEGHVKAPEDFIEALRHETGCEDYSCWWDFSILRLDQQYGAWVIWQRVPTVEYHDVNGVVLGHLTDRFVSVYKLDGMYNRPTELGSWVFEVLNEANEQLAGNANRRRQVDEWNIERAKKEEAELDDWAGYAGKDPFLRRTFAKFDDQFGRPMALKEELVAEQKKKALADERRVLQDLQDAEDMRMWTEPQRVMP